MTHVKYLNENVSGLSKKAQKSAVLRDFAHNMVPGAAFNVGEEDSGRSGRETDRAQGTVTTGLEVRAEWRMRGS